MPQDNLPLEITCQNVKAKLDAGDEFLLLDCRDQAEYDAVHIKGVKLLPMSELANRKSELDGYQDRQIVVHCHHGSAACKSPSGSASKVFPKPKAWRAASTSGP